MKKLIYRGLLITALLVGSFAALSGASAFVQGLSNDKDLGNSLPDPDRPYFDACGNKYAYDGTLIEKGTGCDQASPSPATTTETPQVKNQCQ